MSEVLDQGEVNGLIAAFQTIKNQAEQLLKERKEIGETILHFEHDRVSIPGLDDSLTRNIKQIGGLISEFNMFVDNYCKLLTNKKQQDLLLHESGESACKKIIIRCEFINQTLEERVSPIKPELRNKLQDLKDQLSKISERVDDPDFEKNILHAIEECERGHNLSSWLISGRVIGYIIQKIPPTKPETPIDKKTEYLVEKAIISKDDRETKSLLMKAAKDSRNAGAHQISSFPEAAEAISLLGDSIRLLDKIWIKFQNHENKQP
ncbi:MAG: hypothetical protein WAX07_08485 [Candidatus Altiarchaeia archaeon]